MSDARTRLLCRLSWTTPPTLLLLAACGGGGGGSAAPAKIPAPAVTGLSPASGGVGTSVTVQGSGLTGATALTFNGTSATFSVVSDTQITATVPSGATTGTVQVTAPGGQAASPSAFTVVPAPTISSLNPASGPVGTALVLTGANFAGATVVRFGATSAAFHVDSATQITATVPAGAATGKVTVTTPGGSVTSAGTFTVTASVPPTLTGFSPSAGAVGAAVTLTGTDLGTVSAVRFNGVDAAFTSRGAGQVSATVPPGATTGTLEVVTAGGSAASSGSFTVQAAPSLDLAIQGIQVTQATQTAADGMPLVKDRRATVRVFVAASGANTATPKVKVTVTSGGAAHEVLVAAPGASVPTAVDPENATASWNAAIPAAWVQPGMQVLAEVDPDATVAESDETNNRFPADGQPWTADVRTANTWHISLVPVKTGDGLTGSVTAADLEGYVDQARRMWPLPEVIDVQLGATFTSSAPNLGSDGTNWGTVLSELSAKRSSDGSSRYYYGVVGTTYGGGVAGLGYVPGKSAIGWDKSGSRAGVLAHEVGHNFSRPHSPCGSVAGPDASYPYAGGIIGATGWDAFAATPSVKPKATTKDLMGYCSPSWVSDYCYRKVLDYRAGSATALREEAVQDCLVIWGRVEGGRIVLEPAFPARTRPVAPEPGDWTLEARDASGRVLAALAFAPEEAECEGVSVRSFAFTVPAAALAGAAALEVAGEGREPGRLVLAPEPQAFGSAAPALALARSGEEVELSWDAARYPLVVARDADTGEVLGFQRGGRGRIQAGGRRVELLACEGLRTRAQVLE